MKQKLRKSITATTSRKQSHVELVASHDVAFKEMKAWLVEQRGDAITVHIHAVDMPIRGLENTRSQMMADKTIDANDQDFFHTRKCLKPPPRPYRGS